MPLTVTVQVRDIRVHLLVETVEANHNDTASEELGHTLGMIYLTSLQVQRALLYPLCIHVLNSCHLIAYEQHPNLHAYHQFKSARKRLTRSFDWAEIFHKTDSMFLLLTVLPQRQHAMCPAQQLT